MIFGYVTFFTLAFNIHFNTIIEMEISETNTCVWLLRETITAEIAAYTENCLYFCCLYLQNYLYAICEFCWTCTKNAVYNSRTCNCVTIFSSAACGSRACSFGAKNNDCVVFNFKVCNNKACNCVGSKAYIGDKTCGYITCCGINFK